MTHKILTIPTNVIEINEFIDMFHLKKDSEIFRREILQQMKERWGEELAEDQDGYIDATVSIVEDGKLYHPFNHLKTKELDLYIAEKIGDFSLYGRLWNTTPTEYEIDVPYNIGSVEDMHWVNLSLHFNRNFNVEKCFLTYDSEDEKNKYLTYWILKRSN